MPAKAKSVDWVAVKAQYEAGVRALRDIGEEFGVSAQAILKRAKKEDWTRDLSARIKAKTEAKVNKAMVNALVNSEQKNITDAMIVEVESEVAARIQMSHRQAVPRARRLVMELMAEVEAITNSKELMEEIGEIMYAPDRFGRDELNKIYHKVISLGGRSMTINKLADSLKVLVELERKVFRIDDLPADRPPPSIEVEKLSDEELEFIERLQTKVPELPNGPR